MPELDLFGLIIDKVDLHVQSGKQNELLESFLELDDADVRFKRIMTVDQELLEELKDDFNSIKKAFFGETKALIIQVNQTQP